MRLEDPFTWTQRHQFTMATAVLATEDATAPVVPTVTMSPLIVQTLLYLAQNSWTAPYPETDDRPMPQAELRCHRITLVPLIEEHLDYEIELDSDPDVMRYLGNGTARSRPEIEDAHRRRLTAATLIPGIGYWIGLVEDYFVGWWVLAAPERPDQGTIEGQAELGYRLLPRYWRQGLAGEGARELLRHGFEDLGLTRIFAETMSVNTASRTTMTSIGMEYVRTFHLQFEQPIPGTEHGEVEYAITTDQWRTNQPR
ncbi:GNAT family N-acetyltransferase [Nocardia salmonicida]|uniref:GNAT family N-acetyltransferase n=1 Tax=Nocardia salmonicida TaxID=53431 RepID=UPI0033F2A186